MVETDSTLPQLRSTPMVTDGGLETDLIFHHGIDLPALAAFPLLEDERGRALLTGYDDAYADIAAEAGAGLLLESPTWRANPEWGARLGYGAADLDRLNRSAVQLLQALRDRYVGGGLEGPVLVPGSLGPRGDGYVVGEQMVLKEAADYHRPQLASFAAAGAEHATALTLTYPDEAIGVVLAARDVGLPVAVGFTMETDGRLPDGHRVDDAVATVDASAPPDYFMLDCAHPDHVLAGLEPGPWRRRVVGTRVNASRQSRVELDAAEELDEGDVADLAAA